MSNPYVFPQFMNCGGVWVGLDATPCGSTNDTVADFTGSTATILDAPSFPVPVLAAHSQTLGSTFKVQLPGMWQFIAGVITQTAASVLAGLTFDTVAGDLTIDPQLPDGTRRLARLLRIAAGADTDSMQLVSPPVAVSRDMANDPTLGLFRLMLSNNAGATAAAGALVLPGCYVMALRIGEVPANLRM